MHADVLTPRSISVIRTDLIVSNPPYVPRSEERRWPSTCAPTNRIWHCSLDEEPLLFYRTIATKAYQQLAPGGDLWFEGHHRYTPAVGDLLEEHGFR